MSGIDSPREREKIVYRPRLEYELPHALPGDALEHIDTAVVIARTARFSPLVAAARLKELMAAIPAPLGGDPLFPIIEELRSSLGVVGGLLSQQIELVGDYDSSLREWSVRLSLLKDIESELAALESELPWEAVVYPEEYPEHAGGVEKYLVLQRRVTEAREAANELTRLHFSVADAVNVLTRYLSQVEAFLSSASMPAVCAEAVLPPEAVELLRRRFSRLEEQGDAFAPLSSVVKQQELVDRFIELQRLRLTFLPAVRRAFFAGGEGFAGFLGEELAAEVYQVEEDYRRVVLDLHKTLGLFIEGLQLRFECLRRRMLIGGVV
ncbi:MAG: hypothetical protein AB1330_01355 [Bacillota bacterium]